LKGWAEGTASLRDVKKAANEYYACEFRRRRAGLVGWKAQAWLAHSKAVGVSVSRKAFGVSASRKAVGVAVRVSTYLVLAMLLMRAAAGQSATEATPTIPTLLQVSETLLGEAERQHRVERRMDAAIGRFQALVADLASNDMIDQGKGRELTDAAGALRPLSDTNVPDAARFLEEARRRLEALQPHLASADREIETILRELKRLLDASGATQSIDDLLSELRVLIKDEKQAHEDTRAWGAALYQSPGLAEARRAPLAGAQDQIGKRVDRFGEHLAAAREAEADPVRQSGMRQAGDVLQQENVGALLAGASGDVIEKKPVAAVQKQQKAIEVLERIEALLQPSDAASALQQLQDMREQLVALKKDQQAVRQDVEKTPDPAFAEQKNAFQVRQRDLGNRLSEIKTNAPQGTAPDAQDALTSAAADMQQAESRITQAQREPSAQSQQSVETHLQRAIDSIDKQLAALQQVLEQQNWMTLADIAQKALELADRQHALMEQTSRTQSAALPPLAAPQDALGAQATSLTQMMALPQFKQAESSMQEASQALQQSGQQPAIEGQQAAEKSLREGAQALLAAQQAIDLAQSQYQLMQQTSAAPMTGLPALTPPQQALARQAQAAPFPQAAGLMNQAAQSLQQTQPQPAMQAQQGAINSLMGQAAQALGMQPGAQPGQGIMSAMMPGLMPSVAPTQAPAIDPKVWGSRYFGRQTPAGPDAPKGAGQWNPAMAARDRDMLYLKYARELPMEYRDLIEAYYEALSK
jgi:hypothetical protein